jgi:hypothetical protein
VCSSAGLSGEKQKAKGKNQKAKKRERESSFSDFMTKEQIAYFGFHLHKKQVPPF